MQMNHALRRRLVKVESRGNRGKTRSDPLGSAKGIISPGDMRVDVCDTRRFCGPAIPIDQIAAAINRPSSAEEQTSFILARMKNVCTLSGAVFSYARELCIF